MRATAEAGVAEASSYAEGEGKGKGAGGAGFGVSLFVRYSLPHTLGFQAQDQTRGNKKQNKISTPFPSRL